MNPKKLFASLTLGVVLVFSVSAAANAYTTADGTVTVTWPGYDTNFVDGSPGVPNEEPVVVKIDLAAPVAPTSPGIYTQLPGLPNPSFYTTQKDTALTAQGECIYPGTTIIIATVTTVPALDYTNFTCYFFDDIWPPEDRKDVGFGIYQTTGVPPAAITSATLTFQPRSIVQISKKTNVPITYVAAVEFKNFAMLTPAIEPEPTPPPNPGPQPENELAKTGTDADWLHTTSAVVLTVLFFGVALTVLVRRRRTQS